MIMEQHHPPTIRELDIMDIQWWEHILKHDLHQFDMRATTTTSLPEVIEDDKRWGLVG